MLDIDILNALDDLLAKTLYRAEVNHLPKLTQAEENVLIERARQGDTAASAELVVACLSYAHRLAIHLFTTRRPRHDEAEDLAQVASLAMVRNLDAALTKVNPSAYLRGIARKQMSIYLVYGASHFKMPHFTLAEFAERGGIPTVESLENVRGLQLKITEMSLPPEEANPEQFALLYAALETLPPQFRDRIIWHFHLDLPAGERPLEGADVKYPLKRLKRALRNLMLEAESEQKA